MGRTSEGLVHLRHAVELYDQIRSEGESSFEVGEQAAVCLANLAGAILKEPETARGAERLFRQALPILRELAVESPNVTLNSASIAYACNGLAICCMGSGKDGEVEACFREAVNRYGEIAQRETADWRESRLYGAESLGILTMIYARSGRQDQAQKAFQDADALLLPLRDDPKLRGRAALSLSAACVNLADMRRQMGEAPESLELSERGLDLIGPVLHEEPDLKEAMELEYKLHGLRGQAYHALRRYTEAVADYDLVIARCPPSDRDGYRVVRAAFLAASGQHDRAAAEAESIADKGELTPESRYNLASPCPWPHGEANPRKVEPPGPSPCS